MRIFHTNKRGFTLLEVMVSLAIFGISLCILIVLVGDSLKLASKAKFKVSALELAREKIDAAILGTLGEPVQQGREEMIWEGKTEQGQGWKVEATPWWERHDEDDAPGGKTSDWFLYRVSIGNLKLSTLGKVFDHRGHDE